MCSRSLARSLCPFPFPLVVAGRCVEVHSFGSFPFVRICGGFGFRLPCIAALNHFFSRWKISLPWGWNSFSIRSLTHTQSSHARNKRGVSGRESQRVCAREKGRERAVRRKLHTVQQNLPLSQVDGRYGGWEIDGHTKHTTMQPATRFSSISFHTQGCLTHCTPCAHPTRRGGSNGRKKGEERFLASVVRLLFSFYKTAKPNEVDFPQLSQRAND